jgi:hypothetical protein|tara:strand:- start:254 stop:562 length:309 start_codon:yes stop_codon:yes gene_type:complete
MTAVLVTIITMFIITDTSSQFVAYDSLMECMKDKREITKLRDGRKAICGPSMAELDDDGNIIAIHNKMPDTSGSLKLGGTNATSLTTKKKKEKSGLKVLTKP